MLLDELKQLSEGDALAIGDYVFEVDVNDGRFIYAVNLDDPEHEICISETEHGSIKIDEATP